MLIFPWRSDAAGPGVRVSERITQLDQRPAAIAERLVIGRHAHEYTQHVGTKTAVSRLAETQLLYDCGTLPHHKAGNDVAPYIADHIKRLATAAGRL